MLGNFTIIQSKSFIQCLTLNLKSFPTFTRAAVLFVVENTTCNVFDQRIIEFEMKKICPEITVIRLSLTALIDKIKLGTSKQLYM